MEQLKLKTRLSTLCSVDGGICLFFAFFLSAFRLNEKCDQCIARLRAKGFFTMELKYLLQKLATVIKIADFLILHHKSCLLYSTLPALEVITVCMYWYFVCEIVLHFHSTVYGLYFICVNSVAYSLLNTETSRLNRYSLRIIHFKAGRCFRL